MLARTFIRLCALEALRPSSQLETESPSWPTLATTNVYDSRLDPIDDRADDAARMVAVVYTEDDDLEKITQAGPIFHQSTLDVIFEISALAAERIDGEFVVGYAYTDAELEASLDALENQIWHALHLGPTGALFRKLAYSPALSWKSKPMRSSEEGVRVAARTVTAKYHVREVCYQASPLTAPTGLDRLPPVLKGIADQIADSTYLKVIATAVAGGAPVMPVRVNLEGVSMDIDKRNITTPADSVSDVEASADNLQGA